MLNLLLFLIGLAIFLLGLCILKSGMNFLKSKSLKRIINQFTYTPFLGLVTGTILTAFLQSSSALTVITISLVDTGLMKLTQALGIILGTNIGTTITGQILAFNLESWSVPLFIGGLFFFVAKKKYRYISINIIGLSVIFIGMNYMSQAFLFIEDSPLFYYFLNLATQSKLIAILFGIIATALIQSSSAMTGIVLVLAKNHQLDLVTSTAIILGSNVGTCITAILASIGSTANGKRVATSHVLLNLLGVLIFYPFIEEFSKLMTLTSTSLPRQIAHTQTVFNIVSSLAVLPFTNPFAKLLIWLIPEKK